MKKKKTIIAVILILVIVAIILALILSKKTVLTVTYEVDGQIIKTQEVEKGNTVIKPENPTKEGYDFLGWYLGTEMFDFSTKLKENVKLEAKWLSKTDENNKTYTITLNVDGELEKVKTDASGILDNIENPTKEGYKFLGWYINDEKVDLSKPFEKDTIIVAKWEKEEKEDKKTSNKNNISTNTNSSSNTTTKPSNSNTTTNTTKPSDSSTTKVTKYTVTFNSNGGSSVSKQTIELGKTATKPSNPTKDGYTFVGWYLNDSEYSFSSKVTKNITLKAKWEKAPVITYKIEDVEGSIVGQAKIFVLKDGVKVEGYADVTTSKGTQVATIPATGFDINKNKIVSVDNARLTK